MTFPSFSGSTPYCLHGISTIFKVNTLLPLWHTYSFTQGSNSWLISFFMEYLLSAFDTITSSYIRLESYYLYGTFIYLLRRFFLVPLAPISYPLKVWSLIPLQLAYSLVSHFLAPLTHLWLISRKCFKLFTSLETIFSTFDRFLL